MTIPPATAPTPTTAEEYIAEICDADARAGSWCLRLWAATTYATAPTEGTAA